MTDDPLATLQAKRAADREAFGRAILALQQEYGFELVPVIEIRGIHLLARIEAEDRLLQAR